MHILDQHTIINKTITAMQEKWFLKNDYKFNILCLYCLVVFLVYLSVLSELTDLFDRAGQFASLSEIFQFV